MKTYFLLNSFVVVVVEKKILIEELKFPFTKLNILIN